MFGPNRKSMTLGATPERAYYCVQYLKSKREAITKKDFYEAMCIPKLFGDKKDIFNATYNVLQQLGYLQEVDGKAKGTALLKTVNDANDFRRISSREAFKYEDSLFVRVTSCYCEFAKEFLKAPSRDAVRDILSSHGVKTGNYDEILSWRLWAPFFGCGYLNGIFMIPNWQQRISDLLYDQYVFSDDETVPIAKFATWLKEAAPETAASFHDTEIGLGISNGLRTLHDKEIIEIVSQPDAASWQLVETSGNRQISHIRIRRGANG